MKRVFFTLLITIAVYIPRVQADEGMWMLPLIEEINMADMKELGFALTAEEIYSINNSSLKDAIVIFGAGCTAEIVSGDGLLFTNHHCGYDEIQNHSTVEHDYLADGFWAMSRGEELPNPDLKVRFLRRIEDVSEKVAGSFSEDMSEKEKKLAFNKITDEIEDDASEEGKYEALVKSFFAGNQHYLFVYEIYSDVRLVGAPPSSIGKFGYDSDNWEWPRHTGDFSIFRVYTAPDGSPAKYDEENIPLKPKYHLPISLDGFEKGDFTFIMGFPGSTDRYLSSYGIKETMELVNNTRRDVRGVRQEILMEDMMADQAIRIMYATKYSRSSNYWKYSIGQNQGLKRLGVIAEKQEEEKAFQEWVDENDTLREKYGDILNGIEQIYTSREKHEKNYRYLNEAFIRATELIDFASEFRNLERMLSREKVNESDLSNEIEELRKTTKDFFAEYSPSTDKKVARAMFKLYANRIPPEQHPGIYETINGKYKADYQKFVDKLYDKTIFVSKEQVMDFLDDPQLKTLEKDLGFETMQSIFKQYYSELANLSDYKLELERLQRLYMQGRMEKDPDKKYYPDANFTMRLTYGIVDDYSPADAVKFGYMTYLEGVIEKEDPDDFEFVVPPKLKELYQQKNYGRYGVDGRMPVGFITNNDITGGNSGSPVLNAKGELIGLAFDGNWEAMSGDIAFEPELQRTICVDIRYVLFVIDKFAGAGHLVEELKIAESGQ